MLTRTRNPNTPHPVLLWLRLAPVLCMLTSCAFFNEPNRPTLNALDANIEPETPAGKLALSPVAILVGLSAGAIDMFVVYPAMQVVPSAREVHERYWSSEPAGPALEAALLIPRMTITALDFTGVWILSSIFDLDDGGEEESTPEARVPGAVDEPR